MGCHVGSSVDLNISIIMSTSGTVSTEDRARPHKAIPVGDKEREMQSFFDVIPEEPEEPKFEKFRSSYTRTGFCTYNLQMTYKDTATIRPDKDLPMSSQICS
jgi:hypothetical protein